jgi:uncharacterized membrane protein
MSQPVLFTFEERVGLLFTIEGATYVVFMNFPINSSCDFYLFRSLSIGAVSVILFYALVCDPYFHPSSSSDWLANLLF